MSGEVKLTNLFGEVASERTVSDLVNILAFLVDRLEYGMVVDNAKRLKVNLVESGALGTVNTVSTVTAVTTVNNVANQTLIGGQQAQRLTEACMDTAFNSGIIANISFQ